MLFNSWLFAVFFLVVYVAYLALRDHRRQNILLLAASYFFYSVWDWRFSSLMLATTVVDYCCGRGIGAVSRPGWKRTFLLISIVSNLTVLGFFKYYNFFLGSLDSLLAPLGVSVHTLHLTIVLPVGISFYTFQAISYTVDVYRGDLEPARNPLDFALFVSFFPQLVAGPIERARVLLEQIARPRTLTESAFTSGCWLILWGLWKKVVLADNLMALVDPLFAQSASISAAEAYLAVVAFAFQIYCDFSAYSDMARGVARLMGFELMVNFNSPYFAVNPSDFWRRWHISLSTWLRDYLYIPLGGNRHGSGRTYRNLLLTMGIGGLWHGAAWNFVWWGVYHGLLLCGWKWYSERRPRRAGAGPVRTLLAVAFMFQVTLFGWLLFRCNRTVPLADGRVLDDSFRQIVEMLTAARNGWGLNLISLELALRIVLCAVPLLGLEWVCARQKRVCGEFESWPRPVLIGLASALLFTLLFYGVPKAEGFIYFQF